MSSNRNVFINCPFDKEYQHLFRAIVFTICKLGLNPKISETLDSSINRLDQIFDLMRESKYSVHDISFNKGYGSQNYARFNMPFELGIDFGLKKESRSPKVRGKKLFITETYVNKYDEYISDLSGNDIYSHENDSNKLIKNLRDWFQPHLGIIVSHNEIIDEFTLFEIELGENFKKRNLKISDPYAIPKNEFILITQDWICFRN